jgi:imidazolonepropionase-like amidohydrolase
VSSISINGAAEVLRPREAGLRYMRRAEFTAEPGSVLVDGERIAAFEGSADAAVAIDARGCAVVPGFVDCHTHLPFAGWREREYAMKVAGESYEAIARAGGGIRSSARALADASERRRSSARAATGYRSTVSCGRCDSRTRCRWRRRRRAPRCSRTRSRTGSTAADGWSR